MNGLQRPQLRIGGFQLGFGGGDFFSSVAKAGPRAPEDDGFQKEWNCLLKKREPDGTVLSPRRHFQAVVVGVEGFKFVVAVAGAAWAA